MVTVVTFDEVTKMGGRGGTLIFQGRVQAVGIGAGVFGVAHEFIVREAGQMICKLFVG